MNNARNAVTRPLSAADRVTAELAKSLSAETDDGRRLAAAVVRIADGVHAVEMVGGIGTRRLRLIELTTSELMTKWADYLMANGIRPERAVPCVFAAVLRNASRHGAAADRPMPLVSVALPSNTPAAVVARAAAWIFRDRGYVTAKPADVHPLLPRAAGI